MDLDSPASGLKLLAALLLACALAPHAAGEPAVVLSDPDQIASLAVAWRFQPGDDPSWADPSFDDSGWREIRIPTGFGRFDAGPRVVPWPESA